MKNLEDYHNLYNQVDVLLLSDVFENFRNICCKHYSLDPAHYFTATGLVWDAALKVTEVKLELLSDPDMLLKCNSSPDKKVLLFLHYTNCILHNTIHTVPWCKYL